MKRQAEVSRDHVAMLGALLDGLAAIPRDITTALIARIPIRTRTGGDPAIGRDRRHAPAPRAGVDHLWSYAQNDDRELLELMMRGRTPSQRALTARR
jgi:hypothetical protein